MQEGAPDIRAPNRSGSANHVKRVIEELRELGHQTHLLASYDGQIWSSRDLKTFDPVYSIRFEQGLRRQVERLVRGLQARLHAPYFNWFKSMGFAAAIEEVFQGCDLLYERMGWMGYAGGIAKKRMRIPLVLEVNNGNFLEELKYRGTLPEGVQLKISLRLIHFALNRATHIIASGEGHKEILSTHWGIPEDKIAVVENGTDVINLVTRDQIIAFKPQQSEQSKIQIVFAGTFDVWQGVDVLLKAIKRIIEDNYIEKVVLIGSGDQYETIAALVSSLNLNDVVEFAGHLPINKLATRLSQADIGIAPYCGWHEFSGLKLFDYMAAGLAVITSGRNGHPVTIDHMRTGWIVPPCDEQSLANAISVLASDSALRRRMGREARMQAEKLHSWEQTAKKLEEVFVRVLENVSH